MAAGEKPEVNLEIFGGFFRIPTENLIYNITVIGSQEPQPVRVVERIVEKEKKAEAAPAAPPPAPVKDLVTQEVAANASRELSGIASGLGTLYDTLAGLETQTASSPGPGVDAGTVTALEQEATALAEALASLRDALESGAGAPSAGGGVALPAFDEEITLLRQHLGQARDTALALGEETAMPAAAEAPEPISEKKALYLFDLDVIFQTLYELCTNETVKGHISGARQKAGTIFDARKVREALTERVQGLAPDDGFLNVPITDVTEAMVDGCLEKPIQNLLKKMESSQTTIFLDTILPLPEPEKEEIEVEAAAPAPSPAAPAVGPDPRLADLAAVLDEGLNALGVLEEKVAAGSSAETPSGSGLAVDTSSLDAALEGVRKLVDGLQGLAAQAGSSGGPAARKGGGAKKMQADLLQLCSQLLAVAAALAASGEHGPGEDAAGIMAAASRRAAQTVDFSQAGGATGVRRALSSLGL